MDVHSFSIASNMVESAESPALDDVVESDVTFKAYLEDAVLGDLFLPVKAFNYDRNGDAVSAPDFINLYSAYTDGLLDQINQRSGKDLVIVKSSIVDGTLTETEINRMPVGEIEQAIGGSSSTIRLTCKQSNSYTKSKERAVVPLSYKINETTSRLTLEFVLVGAGYFHYYPADVIFYDGMTLVIDSVRVSVTGDIAKFTFSNIGE